MKLRTLAVCLAMVGSALAAPPAHASAGSKIYVATALGEIYTVDSATGATDLLHQTGLFGGDFDLALCADGRLYVSAGDQILRLRRDGTEVETIFNNVAAEVGSDASGLFVGGLVCDSGGNLLINAKFNDVAAIWRIGGVTSAPFGGPFATPEPLGGPLSGTGEEVVVLHDGRVAAVSGEGRVDVFSRGFAESSTLIAETGSGPIGFAQNGAGNLFVADIFAVAQYDASGTFMRNAFEVADEFPYRVDVELNGNLLVTTDNGLWRVGANGEPQLLASVFVARGIAIDREFEAPDVRTLRFGPRDRVASVQYGNATVQIRYAGKARRAFDVQVERRLVAPSSLEAGLPRNTDPLSLPGDGGFISVLTLRADGADDNGDRRGRGRGDDDDVDGRFLLTWAYNLDTPLNRPRVMVEEQHRRATVFENELDFFWPLGAFGMDMVSVVKDVSLDSQFFLANGTRPRR